jgi:hypothetical protein
MILTLYILSVEFVVEKVDTFLVVIKITNNYMQKCLSWFCN